MNKKLRKFKKKEQEKRRTAYRKKITDQFTLQGFFTVSGYAVVILMMLFPVLGLLKMTNLSVVVTFNWKWCSFVYFICWLISFWIFCLSPKFRDGME